jgi:Rrf2 family protein
MRVTARLSYGLGALVDLAATHGETVKGETLAARHDVSVGFLENILADLRRTGIVQSRRGGNGGYWLARPATEITVADVIRILDGQPSAATAIHDSRLFPVWDAITQASTAAAEALTLAALATGIEVGRRGPPGWAHRCRDPQGQHRGRRGRLRPE